jgi:hypothetical protein
MTSRTAGREIDRRICRCRGRKQQRYQENPQLYRTAEINEHIFGTKDNGNHTHLTGLEKCKHTLCFYERKRSINHTMYVFMNCQTQKWTSLQSKKIHFY